MLPVVRRTWAPAGQTPVLYHVGRHREKVSSLSAITVSPQRRRLGLYIRFFAKRNIKARHVVAFLKQLLRHLGGHVIVLWDRGRQHMAAETKRFLRVHHRKISADHFPAYAPDLNPDEHVWALFKNHRLANHGFPSVHVLHRRLLYHARRTRKHQSLLWSCIHASELPLEKP